MELTFLGAVGTVTGSKYLLKCGTRRVLVDCGLFQGLKQLRTRNRQELPFDPTRLDAVVLTHAHLDHSGFLPLLVKRGFKGDVLCTAATRDLCHILLPDSGYLQEEEAFHANKHGYGKHKPALPLYTRDDAVRSLRSLKPVDFDRNIALDGKFHVRFTPSGHILGAASVTLEYRGHSILFSGDIGRPNDPVMFPPEPCEGADWLVVESTYGDRRHDSADPQQQIAGVIARTVRRGGVIVIPAFAVGRAQTVLYYLHRLRARGEMPDIPIYLDSPMATEATQLFQQHADLHRLDPDECRGMCSAPHYVTTADESRAIDGRQTPMVILSASGMATGGRVLHHIKAFAPDPRNTILFVGFQAAGTRGAAMVAGATSVRIHGMDVPIKAEVVSLDSMSAHADQREVLEWMGRLRDRPKQVFVTHGEPVAADTLRRLIEQRFGWPARAPEYGETVKLK